MARSVYGRTLSPQTRYGPKDEKAAVDLLIAEYARQRDDDLSRAPAFKAGQIIPRGSYGSKGPLTTDEPNVFGSDYLEAALGGELDKRAFKDRFAMNAYLNKEEIEAMKQQLKTNEDYRKSLEPKKSGGGIWSKIIGGAKVAVGLSTGNYGLAISGGADLAS